MGLIVPTGTTTDAEKARMLRALAKQVRLSEPSSLVGSFSIPADDPAWRDLRQVWAQAFPEAALPRVTQVRS